MSQTSAYKVRIDTGSTDTEALILLADGALVGVLVQLSNECHQTGRGKWTIEATFGVHTEGPPSIFSSAVEAANWLSIRLACGPFLLGEKLAQLP